MKAEQEAEKNQSARAAASESGGGEMLVSNGYLAVINESVTSNGDRVNENKGPAPLNSLCSVETAVLSTANAAVSAFTTDKDKNENGPISPDQSLANTTDDSGSHQPMEMPVRLGLVSSAKSIEPPKASLLARLLAAQDLTAWGEWNEWSSRVKNIS